MINKFKTIEDQQLKEHEDQQLKEHEHRFNEILKKYEVKTLESLIDKTYEKLGTYKHVIIADFHKGTILYGYGDLVIKPSFISDVINFYLKKDSLFIAQLNVAVFCDKTLENRQYEAIKWNCEFNVSL